jgi:hypothetical protein
MDYVCKGKKITIYFVYASKLLTFPLIVNIEKTNLRYTYMMCVTIQTMYTYMQEAMSI